MAEQGFELPLEVIRLSPGVAFDIGSSVAKIVYRSKEDFENGELRDKDKTSVGVGTIRQKQIRRENITEVIEFIKEHVDLTRDEKGDCKIYSTGIGGNLFSKKIEEDLGVQLVNLSEFDCFVGAATTLLKTQSSKELFNSVNKKALEEVKPLKEKMAGFKHMTEINGKGTMTVKTEIEDYNVDEDSRFPFLLAMCGSGFGFLKVNEDGTFHLLKGSGIAGRFFLGLVSYLADIIDFDEIAKEIEQSNGRTADLYGSDLVDKTVKDDIYADFKETRMFALSKGMTDKKAQTTKGDLIHSVLESICENTADLAYLTASTNDIPRVYFTGNFVNTPKAQQFITRMMLLNQRTEAKQVNFEFLKHGGILGAIGAFTEPYNLHVKKAKS